MKDTGMVRPIDKLGRVVIPKEIRKMKDIAEHENVEIFVEGEDIIIRKYNPCCTFCGESHDIIEYGGKRVCKKCANAIHKEAV